MLARARQVTKVRPKKEDAVSRRHGNGIDLDQGNRKPEVFGSRRPSSAHQLFRRNRSHVGQVTPEVFAGAGDERREGRYGKQATGTNSHIRARLLALR